MILRCASVDTTRSAPSEGELQGIVAPAAGGVDLLTVLIHEFAHQLGYEDHAGGSDALNAELGAGVRRVELPEDAVFANTDLLADVLS